MRTHEEPRRARGRRTALAAGLTLLATAALATSARAAKPAPTASPVVTRALDALRAECPGLRATFAHGRATPASLTGLDVAVAGDTPEVRAEGFVARHAPIFGVPASDLAVRAVATAGARTNVTLAQRHEGLDVEGKSVVVTLEGRRVVGVTNGAQPITALARATISAESARLLALEAVHGPATAAPLSLATITRHALAVRGGRAVEIYRVGVLRKPLVEQLEVLVDAHEGRVIGLTNLLAKGGR